MGRYLDGYPEYRRLGPGRNCACACVQWCQVDDARRSHVSGREREREREGREIVYIYTYMEYAKKATQKSPGCDRSLKSLKNVKLLYTHSVNAHVPKAVYITIAVCLALRSLRAWPQPPAAYTQLGTSNTHPHTHTPTPTHRSADPAASPLIYLSTKRCSCRSEPHRAGSYFITIPLRKLSRSADATWHMDDSKPSCAMCAPSSIAASSKALPKLLCPSPFQ